MFFKKNRSESLDSPYRMRCVLSVVVLFLAVSISAATKYDVGRWKHVLGTHRALFEVEKKSDAVWAHIPWRRRDKHPERKGVLVVDLKTGRRVGNVARVNITKDFGDVVFQPATAPGRYAVYYLPLSRIRRRPTGTCDFRYAKPFDSADPQWRERNGLGENRYLESDFRERFPTAKLIKMEARSDFDRFDPMEIPATRDELERLREFHPDADFLLYAESRRRPVRMLDNIPFDWIRKTPGSIFTGNASRGEFFVFQIAVFAIEKSLKDLRLEFNDLKTEDGKTIPHSAIKCFNTGGNDALGHPFEKRLDLKKGKVLPLWIEVQIPKNARPGKYSTVVRVYCENGRSAAQKVILNVSGKLLKDGGVSDLWRLSRLKWLDSKLGLEDTVTAPYTPMTVKGNKIEMLGKSVIFEKSGLPKSLKCGGNEILAAPVRFEVETKKGVVRWSDSRTKTKNATPTNVIRTTLRGSKKLVMSLKTTMEYDGYAYYNLELKALSDLELKDARLLIPYRKEFATYMMGLNSGPGGFRKSDVKWSWSRWPNNKVWMGDVEAGLRCKLRGEAKLEDIWAEYTPEVDGIPKSWGNDGKGGCVITEKGATVLFKAFSGARKMKAGETMAFNFSLLLTPVKPRNPKHWCDPRQWSWRYSMLTKPPKLVKKLGCDILTAFHGSPQNPWINYPFKRIDKLKKWINETHALGMKAKIYYTLGELSNHATELWTLRALGDECLAPGKGGGGEWLREHLLKGYHPKWYCTPLGIEGVADASVELTGTNRWFNYYVASVKWLAETQHIDGIYYDGARFSRRILRRVRRVLDQARPGALLDYHAGNNITRRSNTFNDAMEHLAYLDSTWIGEGFNYNRGPDFYMVELSGIPFGIPNNMLEGGGNPWRGMLYGMSTRYIENHAGAPTTLWRFWDEFGIEKSRMIGYWDKNCPVKTGRKDVLATVFKRKGKSLIAIASWAKKDVSLKLSIDWKQLGINPSTAELSAPLIPEFQEKRRFSPDAPITVSRGRGWLLVLEEAKSRTNGSTMNSSNASRNIRAKVLFKNSLKKEKALASWRTGKTDGVESKIETTPEGTRFSAPSDSELWAERALPAGADSVECSVLFPLETPVWRRRRLAGLQAPGLSVVWGNGHTVRISFAGKGAFTIDDEVMDHMYRFVPSLMGDAQKGFIGMKIEWNDEFVLVRIRDGGGRWLTLRAIPRTLFPDQPKKMRIGKMGKKYGWPRTLTLKGEKDAQSPIFKDVVISARNGE